MEILRQPLEERRIFISRASGTYQFPADFMLVAAMNPCACGYYPDRNRCHCAERAVERYLGKISQPLLDRIDICSEVAQVSYEDLTTKQENESSARIRARVMEAQERQQERYRDLPIHFNSQLKGDLLKAYCELAEAEENLLKQAFQKLNLSARAYHKIIRVARTIADLDGAKKISCDHLLEAVRYRPPSRNDWIGGA